VIHKPARRSLSPLLALTFLAIALVVALRPASAPYLTLLRQGDEHAARAERTAAVAAYREAAHLRPKDPLPHLRLAQLYLDWGRTDNALAALVQAERLGADEGELERLHVAIHTARADWRAVTEHARRMLDLMPDNDAARHALARAYVELREWDAARAEYQELLRTDPTDPVAHERLGALLLGDSGDERTAALQHLFAAGTDLADRLLAAMEEPGAADDPAYASALLGRALFEEQEWALAVHHFERAISHNPEYADAHAYLGYALDQMNLPNEAQRHLLQATALAPDSAVAHTFLGLHYDRLGDPSAARTEYEMAYDLDPQNPATCVEIGQAWAAEGRYVAAEVWLLEAVSLQPDDPALWEILARFYLDHHITAAGQPVEAATKLVELAPGDARAHDLLGWAALQTGDYETAHDSLLQAISLDPELPSAYYHLGLLWTAQEEHQKAQTAFTRALDLDTTGELIPLIEQATGSK